MIDRLLKPFNGVDIIPADNLEHSPVDLAVEDDIVRHLLDSNSDQVLVNRISNQGIPAQVSHVDLHSFRFPSLRIRI